MVHFCISGIVAMAVVLFMHKMQKRIRPDVEMRSDPRSWFTG
jgi:hypothetical protein